MTIFELEEFTNQLTDDWVLEELKVGEYAESEEQNNESRID